MYGAFGFVKVQNPRGTGELRQIKKDDGKTGNSEGNCRNQRLHSLRNWQVNEVYWQHFVNNPHETGQRLSYETLCLSHSLDTGGRGVVS